MASGSKGVVLAALFANAAIAVLKFGGYLLTLSPAMLSETYHSISDTGNQIFLLFGIQYSEKEPSRSHPFGYGKAQFFYSFLVSVLLFGIAGWESLKHGWNALTAHGHAGGGTPITLPVVGTFDPVWVNVVVLLGAIAFESYAFRKAHGELRSQIEEYGWTGIPQAFRRTSDVTTLTAFTEDAVALGGAGIALVGVLASHVTGNPVYDAAAAVCIGLLLMGFAVALAWENKRLLIGESLPTEDERALRDVVQDHESVEHVDAMRTVFFGPGTVVVTADVSFDPDLVTGDIDEDITEIEAALRRADERVKVVFVEPEL